MCLYITATPASAVEGWKVGKSPSTLRVVGGGAGGAAAAAEAGPGTGAGAGAGDEIEDPAVIHAQVAAAAALLGDCCLPYASNPVVSDMFL